MWTDEPTDAQRDEIGELLRDAYDRVVARLEEHRALLDEVVEVLVEKQELDGAELRRLPGVSTSIRLKADQLQPIS
jgi:ATP-dependent Zn protease